MIELIQVKAIKFQNRYLDCIKTKLRAQQISLIRKRQRESRKGTERVGKTEAEDETFRGRKQQWDRWASGHRLRKEKKGKGVGKNHAVAR